MNIQDYYRKTASISLNASLASLVPPIFFMLYGLIAAPNKYIALLLIPFFLYSFVCYHYFLRNDQWSKEMGMVSNEIKDKRFLEENQVLITFLPAPTLRMLIFDEDGEQLAEIKDMNFWLFRWFLPYFSEHLFPKKYGIFDREGSIAGSFILKKKQIDIMEFNSDERVIITCLPSLNQFAYFLKDQEKNIVVKHSSLYTDFQFFMKDSGIPIGRLRKGWLPANCGVLFKDPNTPLVTFDSKLTPGDKLVIYAIITKHLRCSNH